MYGYCCFFFNLDDFLDNYSYFDHRFFRQSSQLNRAKNTLPARNQRRRTNQAVKNPEQIEKYAREKYYMKGQRGYLHHRIEGDSIENK
jgi:hypothetical protein